MIRQILTVRRMRAAVQAAGTMDFGQWLEMSYQVQKAAEKAGNSVLGTQLKGLYRDLMDMDVDGLEEVA